MTYPRIGTDLLPRLDQISLGGSGFSAVEDALGVDGFGLARTVHGPEQVGEMGGVGSGHLADRVTGSVQAGFMSPRARATNTPGGGDADRATGTSLRADAARNVAQIRAAALSAFRGRGLSTPLEEIAAAAGVSKATIYNRFGGRQGLIDAVIAELVATEMYAALDKARLVEDPWERIATYVTDRRDLQYREPAAIDALLMTYPDSEPLVALAKAATDMTISWSSKAMTPECFARTSPPPISTTPTSPTGSPSATGPNPPARITTDAPASSSTACARADKSPRAFLPS